MSDNDSPAVISDRVSEVLPDRSAFLRPYVDYATTCSDAPDIYHVGVGLTVFAGAIAHKVTCPYQSGSALVPNLYTLLVGPSRSARKTSSMDMGINLLGRAHPEAVIPVPGSYEELVAQIRLTPAGLLTYREFGHFLKTTVRGYGEPIRTILMDLFDWPNDRQYIRNLRKGKTVIEPPIVLSMLSAVSTDLLFLFTDLEEWVGGFFGRMLMLYGERNEFRLPYVWAEMQQYLTMQLHSWCNINLPQCGGFSPDAWQFFNVWSAHRDSQTHHAPDRVQTHVAGATTLAAKISLLYAVDAHEPATGHGWLVSSESMRKAMLFVDKLYLPSVYSLGEQLQNSPWERDRHRVLRIITNKGGPIDHPELLRKSRMSSNNLKDVIDTLREEGTITQRSGSKGLVYALANNVIQFPGGDRSGNTNSGQAG